MTLLSDRIPVSKCMYMSKSSGRIWACSLWMFLDVFEYFGSFFFLGINISSGLCPKMTQFYVHCKSVEVSKLPPSVDLYRYFGDLVASDVVHLQRYFLQQPIKVWSAFFWTRLIGLWHCSHTLKRFYISSTVFPLVQIVTNWID